MSYRRVAECLGAPPCTEREPVGYASDLGCCLSTTPSTLIGAVDGVVDRTTFLSMA